MTATQTRELFRRQRKFAGERLTSINEGEEFILIDMAVVLESDTELAPGSTVDKTELIVSLDGGKTAQLFSTLSGPIRDIAYMNERDESGKSTAEDLPAVVSWHKVETKRSRGDGTFNDATVLTFHSRYTGKLPANLPAWSFDPVNTGDHPF